MSSEEWWAAARGTGRGRRDEGDRFRVARDAGETLGSTFRRQLRGSRFALVTFTLQQLRSREAKDG
jgi:hypothetical protein